MSGKAKKKKAAEMQCDLGLDLIPGKQQKTAKKDVLGTLAKLY